MVTIAKYIPATEEHDFNDFCDNHGAGGWRDPRCPWCTNKMEVCALRCMTCGGEWRDGEMTKGKGKDKDKK
jgi:hypothetical protein